MEMRDIRNEAIVTVVTIAPKRFLSDFSGRVSQRRASHSFDNTGHVPLLSSGVGAKLLILVRAVG